MNTEVTFGEIVKERRTILGLTQAELARRVGCAVVTIRKIEYDTLRPSAQIAELLATALNIPDEERFAFVRLARAEREPTDIPSPSPVPEEIGQENLSGRAVRGYQLGERLAVGGFGAVYRAVQPLIERDVAIKIILPQYANHPDFIRRFEAEAQIVARLEHPYIVPLYDYWREPGVAYLVMRMMRGGSLFERLKDGPLPVEMTLQVLQQIGAALDNAHRSGIIHRDLKPANILLDEDDNAYLADFGFAKDLGQAQLVGQSEAGSVVGSLEYISPEQIQAEPVKTQTDIYCLGVVLYELLTGLKPFQGPSPIDYMQQHLRQPVPSLVEANGAPDRALQVALDPVIARATAKDPSNRYPNVPELVAEFRQAAALVLADDGQLAAEQITPTLGGQRLDVGGQGIELENPYKGLRAFGEADAGDFYGRETLIQALLGLLSEPDDLARFLAVVGPSGSGKSSLVKAGLIPALRRGGLPGSENWFIVDFMPGARPLEELEAALLRVAVSSPAGLLSQLEENERGLVRAAKRILPDDDATELLLVIDQFEEVFTLGEDEASRVHFLANLVAAVLDPRSRIRVVITLRADFTDRPLQYVDFAELVRQRTEFVVPLTPEELEEAITGPSTQQGLVWEPGLVATIIGELGDQPGTLPLLQYGLTELFERRQGRQLTLAGYEASGGVLGALARRADELYEELAEPEQAAAQQLFLRLVTLGEGVEDTRRRVLRSELAALNTNAIGGGRPPDDKSPNGQPVANSQQSFAAIDHVLERYGRYRLLTFDHDPVTREPTVEVAHEALLREWRRLRDWLDANRTDIRLQRLLASATTEWIEAGRDPGFLLRGSRLDQFEGWARGTELALTYNERTYLRTSQAARRARRAGEESRRQRELETARKLAETEKARSAEHARSAYRLRWLAIGLALFLLLALGMAWLAFSQRNIAQDNFESAERIRLAAQAQVALDNGEGGDLPALLALRSLQHGYSPEADAALLDALSRGFTRQRYFGHTGMLREIEFSPDGRYVLSASADNTARLWDARTGAELRQFIGHTDLLNSAIFSPDGQTALTGSLDGTVRLWNVQTGQELRRFAGHAGGVTGIAFAPDGEAFISGGFDRIARLWDVATGREIRQFTGHEGAIAWVDFSPVGRYIATGSEDNSARVWDIETGQQVRQFDGHTDCACTVVFSPDGERLLTVGYDRTARLWNIETGFEIRRFVGHTDLLFDGTYSPDGRYVLTGSLDKTARLWDVKTGQAIFSFTGHNGPVLAIAFSADGRHVLTGSEDRTVRLWDTETGRELYQFAGHTGPVLDVAVSPDGRLVLSGSEDNTGRLWDAESGQELHQFVGHTDRVARVAFSPDGRYPLTGSADQTAHLWDAETGQILRQYVGHASPLLFVGFSAGGETVLTGDTTSAFIWRTMLEEVIAFTCTQLSRDVSEEERALYNIADDEPTCSEFTERTTAPEPTWTPAPAPTPAPTFTLPPPEPVPTEAEIVELDFVSDAANIQAGIPMQDVFIDVGNDQIERPQDLSAATLARPLFRSTERIEEDFLEAPFEVGPFEKGEPLGFTVKEWLAAAGHGTYAQTGDRATIDLTFENLIPNGLYTLWCVEINVPPDTNVIDRPCGAPDGSENVFTADEAGRLTAKMNIKAFPPSTEETIYALALGYHSDQQTHGEYPGDYGFNLHVQLAYEFSPPGLSPEPAPPVPEGAQVLDMVFNNDAANLQLGAPMQDVYIEIEDGQIFRPQDVEATTLAQPLYRATELIEPDFLEEPFEVGPFEKGDPLGLTLADWLAATGVGTYAVTGSQAQVDLHFENLIPNGVYTLWCSEVRLPPVANVIDRSCGASDGSENVFLADESGQIDISMQIEAMPPTTDDAIFSFGLAYHSDGQTHGSHPGEFGLNLHVQLFFELPPPSS